MKKLASFIISVCLAACVFSGCASGENRLDKISQALSVDCSGGTLSDEYDSHGGFHGDGTYFCAISFDSPIDSRLSGGAGWKSLPMSQNVSALVYGEDIDDVFYAPAVTKENDWNNPLFPRIENGMYLFADRFSELSFDDSNVLKRGAYNFTVALYDADTYTIYYCEVDT